MVLTSRTKVPGDLIPHIESLEYCTKTAIVRNPHSAEVTMNDIVGYPVIAGTNGADYNLAMAGDEADVVGLLMDVEPADEVIPAATNGTAKYQVLIHPPVNVNQDKIATLDVAGDAFTLATIITALEADKWEFRREPTVHTP
jgi:hypothetical protein